MWIVEYDKFIEESLNWIENVKQVLPQLKLENWHQASFLERLQNIEQNVINLTTTKDEHMIWEIQSWITQLQEDIQIYYRNVLSRAMEVSIGKHVLPDLPYSYDALEPYISQRIMYLHHKIHHQSYVDGLNTAEKKLAESRANNNFDLIKHWERELAFNGSGDYLHSIFWEIMSPRGGGVPKGELLTQINRDFSSFDLFKKQFSECASKVEGSGWAIAVYVIPTKRIEILQSEKHQNGTQWNTIPILVCDVWEHAYYLQYENKRADYVKNWWEIVNWDEVAKRYKKAKSCYGS